jgi:hypothetical protein
MEPLEFLAEVLPPPGNGRYCVVELSKRKEHVYVDTLDQAQTKIDAWNKQGLDVYFALGTFGDLDSRVATNVQMVRCIAVDVDCNHPKDIPDPETGELKTKAYPSAKAAAQAIMQFADEVGLSGLGNPWLVASGGGVHAYWPFKETVDINEWKPVAEGFKRLCFQKKLAIDQTITADASRVLRVFDTVNTGIKGKKKVREVTQVKFKNAGDHFDFNDIRALVEKHLVGTAYEVKAPREDALMLPGTRPTQAPTGTMLEMFKNSVTKFGNIYKATKEGRGCEQLRYYAEHASEDGMEPLWRAHLSIAQKCKDGEKAVIWLSSLHPYDEDRMRTKLAEIKGPYPCTKFDSENPGVCTTCTHWGKITNPLVLGRETAVSTEVKEIVVEQENGHQEKIVRPEPPRGYAYGQHGGVFMEREDEDADGKKTKRQIMLLPFDLFPVDILNIKGEHTIYMMALRKTGPQEVTLPQRAIVSKDETLKNLAGQNIVAAFGAGNDKNLFDYVRASVEKLSSEKAPVEVPDHYGWQPDGTFLHGGMIYKANEKPVRIPLPGLENIVTNTQITGTMENWVKFINLLISRKLWDQLAIIFLGAGAPLMRFTGLYGLTVHCCSTASGTGKSLALDGAASIWGHPMHYRTGSQTSPVAMQQRLGMLHSLPFVSDEITTLNHKDVEWFPAFTMTVSEGRGKERMESGANKERLNLSTWATIALLSSNTHGVDYMTGVRKFSSEGELRRQLEWIINEKLSWTPEEIEIIKSIQDNYGVAGDVWSQHLVDNTEAVKEMTKKTVTQMYKVFHAPNDERFWMAGVGCAVTAALCFGSKYAGIVDVPIEPMIESYRRAINTVREAMTKNKRSAEDILNSFIQEHFGKFVIVHYGDKAGPMARLGDSTAVDKNTTRSQIMGRIEHGVSVGYVDFYIEERVLKSYCSGFSFGYAEFKAQIEKQFVVSYIAKKDLLSKTNGPPMRVGVIKITREEDQLDEEVKHPLALAQS